MPHETDHELLERLTVDDPRARSQEGLDDGCFFCGEDRQSDERHKGRHGECWDRWQLHRSSCAWVAARKALDLPVYVCWCGAQPKVEFPFTDANDSAIDVTASDQEAGA